MAFQFETLNNTADLTFNQLLGINNAGTIAGYFGSGTPPTAHPNKGYTLAAPYGQGNYTNENYPGSQQTQVTAIDSAGLTVGFWADANVDNFGFVDNNGTFTNVVDPNAPVPASGTPSVEQLLGVNDQGLAVGFYTDASGNNHGFIYNIGSATFTPVTIDGSTSVTATSINNAGEISGFYLNGTATDGFIDNNGAITTLTGPQGASNVMALGLNNKGEVVGSYVDSAGNTDGFLYDVNSGLYTTIIDPKAKPTTPGGPTQTVVNGLNDKGQLVGFYMDSAGNIDGMLVNTRLTQYIGPPLGFGHLELGANNAVVTLSGDFNTVAGKKDGWVSVSGGQNNNFVKLGNGNDNVSLAGNNNAVELGRGNDTVNVGGTGNAVILGAGKDVITTGATAGGDVFVLDGSKASLVLHGSNNLVYIDKGNNSITDNPAGSDNLLLQVRSHGGSAAITNFSTANGVVDLVPGLGFKNAADMAAYANSHSDGHGGSLLQFKGGSIDFVGIAPGSLQAHNFQV